MEALFAVFSSLIVAVRSISPTWHYFKKIAKPAWGLPTPFTKDPRCEGCIHECHPMGSAHDECKVRGWSYYELKPVVVTVPQEPLKQPQCEGCRYNCVPGSLQYDDCKHNGWDRFQKVPTE